MVRIDLNGRTILVTGALGAIAEHVNRRLIEAGARLLLTDILPPTEAEEKLERAGLSRDSWEYSKMDVTDGSGTQRCIGSLLEKHGQIHTLLGLAGGCGLHPFHSTSPEAFGKIFDFNFFGQVHPARTILAAWERQSFAGHIIFTSSLVGSLPWVDLSAYCTAKAALEMFARCLALEYAQKGIRFNCVAPGIVAAGSSNLVYETDKEYREKTDRVIPLGRRTAPEAVADTFLFLCSDLANDLNGQVIKVDGGASIPKVG